VRLCASSHGTLLSLRELGGSATGVLITDQGTVPCGDGTSVHPVPERHQNKSQPSDRSVPKEWPVLACFRARGLV